jgi:2-dehydro-3-deoxyphosphogluconate aldolase/(4S)-4-hydroxy-2-oxoglutarate aldolase
MQTELANRLFAQRIVPVVVVSDAERADDLADALIEGGLPVAEVTFRTPSAADVMRRMARHDGLLVGAGTVVDATQVDVAADCGAAFIVSPGLSAAVVRRATERGLLVLPGAVTPTEIIAALDLGLSIVKFFPAHLYGGAAAIKALSAPFGGVQFVPTGGVSADNLGDYLSLPCVPGIGGTWMVNPQLVEAGEFDTIRDLCAAAVAAASAV